MSTDDPLSGGEIPFPYAERNLVIKLFRSTQCSGCKKFYTIPFLCPFNQPQSNCILLNPLSDEERNKFLSDPRWTSIMEDQMRHLQKDGIIARCRKCKALNPNPKSNTCWKCEESLICPSCGVSILRYDIGKNIWKCPDSSCGKTFGIAEETTTVFVVDKPPVPPITPPSWLLPSLLMFALSIVGLGISLYVGSFIPFGMLLIFFTIFSIQKWFGYVTNKHKWVGKLYKLLLNLLILSSLAVIFWSGLKLFSQQFLRSPLIGSLVFLSELIFFIWLCRIFAKHSWRWPSMKLTIFSLIVLFFVFAFAGVQPIASYKDAFVNPVISFFKNSSPPMQEIPNTNQSQFTQLIPVPSVKPVTIPNLITPVTIPTPAVLNVSAIDRATGQYKNYYLGLVKEPEGTESNSYGNFIVLINNKDARNTTYSQLISFLKSDRTDQYLYTYVDSAIGSYYGSAESHVDLASIQSIIDGTKQPNPPRICADFAEMLHNNAEKAGIRCAYVTVQLSGYTDPYHYGIPSNSGHALVAFDTTDRGLIYIDATGGSKNAGPSRNVTTVNVQISKSYIPQSLFPEPGWNTTWESMGTVTNIFMTWDGKWNN